MDEAKAAKRGRSALDMPRVIVVLAVSVLLGLIGSGMVLRGGSAAPVARISRKATAGSTGMSFER